MNESQTGDSTVRDVPLQMISVNLDRAKGSSVQEHGCTPSQPTNYLIFFVFSKIV